MYLRVGVALQSQWGRWRFRKAVNRRPYIITVVGEVLSHMQRNTGVSSGDSAVSIDCKESVAKAEISLEELHVGANQSCSAVTALH